MIYCLEFYVFKYNFNFFPTFQPRQLRVERRASSTAAAVPAAIGPRPHHHGAGEGGVQQGQTAQVPLVRGDGARRLLAQQGQDPVRLLQGAAAAQGARTGAAEGARLQGGPPARGHRGRRPPQAALGADQVGPQGGLP
jgi:hypothetical protein